MTTEEVTKATPRARPAGEIHWAVLPTILSATFLALFDFNVVNVAAPSVQDSLHASEEALQFVVAGYAFSYAAGLITGGRLGDRFGHRRVFLWGMAAFVLASAACGAAQTPAQLIVARFVQGAAAAVMVPQVLAMITRLFTGERLPRALAWFGVVLGLGSIAGQVLGGVLVEAQLMDLGWRLIFLVNVPVGLVALLLAARLIPAGAQTVPRRFDFVGIVAVSGSLALVLVPLILGSARDWPTWSLVLLIAAVPASALAIRHQTWLTRRGGEPLLDLELFRRSSFDAGLAINVLVYVYVGSFFLSMSVFLQDGLALSPTRSGLTFAVPALGFAVAAVAARPLVARFGRNLVRAGLVLNCVSLALLLAVFHFSGDAIDVARLSVPLTLTWIGNGLILPTAIGVTLAGIDLSKAGAAGGTLTTGQQFGMAVGVALLSIVFFHQTAGPETLTHYSAMMQRVFLLDLVIMAVSLVLAQWLPAPPKPTAAPASR
ncbi:MFS transporter [Nocardia takedensis]